MQGTFDAKLFRIQSTYMSKDGMEITEVLTGVPEALQPLYREVMPVGATDVNIS